MTRCEVDSRRPIESAVAATNGELVGRRVRRPDRCACTGTILPEPHALWPQFRDGALGGSLRIGRARGLRVAEDHVGHGNCREKDRTCGSYPSCGIPRENSDPAASGRRPSCNKEGDALRRFGLDCRHQPASAETDSMPTDEEFRAFDYGNPANARHRSGAL